MWRDCHRRAAKFRASRGFSFRLSSLRLWAWRAATFLLRRGGRRVRPFCVGLRRLCWRRLLCACVRDVRGVVEGHSHLLLRRVLRALLPLLTLYGGGPGFYDGLLLGGDFCFLLEIRRVSMNSHRLQRRGCLERGLPSRSPRPSWCFRSSCRP